MGVVVGSASVVVVLCWRCWCCSGGAGVCGDGGLGVLVMPGVCECGD